MKMLCVGALLVKESVLESITADCVDQMSCMLFTQSENEKFVPWFCKQRDVYMAVSRQSLK